LSHTAASYSGKSGGSCENAEVPDQPGPFGESTIREFSDRLASSDPVPGGGSACAVVASLAASLVAMVARLSLDRPRYAEHRELHERAIVAADRSRVRLLELADEDAAAYAAFGAARKFPRETLVEKSKRDNAIARAALLASEVPLEVCRESVAIIELAMKLAGRSNVNAASDLDVAVLLARASLDGAGANVRVNLPALDDESVASRLDVELQVLLERSTLAARAPTAQ
jgi:glutamate formiminotransferase/formiminotetrahydrofolate cyclodeaminase